VHGEEMTSHNLRVRQREKRVIQMEPELSQQRDQRGGVFGRCNRRRCTSIQRLTSKACIYVAWRRVGTGGRAGGHMQANPALIRRRWALVRHLVTGRRETGASFRRGTGFEDVVQRARAPTRADGSGHMHVPIFWRRPHPRQEGVSSLDRRSVSCQASQRLVRASGGTRPVARQLTNRAPVRGSQPGTASTRRQRARPTQ
jgi:hypothetical protein